MAEIFGRVPLAWGGSFSADAANIFFGTLSPALGGALAGIGALGVAGGAAQLGLSGGGTLNPITGIGLITQNINFQYAQPVNRIFEVGGHFEYYIVGRPQGNASLGQIVGPRPVSIAFYSTLGNACLGPKLSLIFAGAAGCSSIPTLGGQNGFIFQLVGPLIQSIGASVTAQDMVINAMINFMFISLLIPDAPDPTQSAQAASLSSDSAINLASGAVAGALSPDLPVSAASAATGAATGGLSPDTAFGIASGAGSAATVAGLSTTQVAQLLLLGWTIDDIAHYSVRHGESDFAAIITKGLNPQQVGP